MEQCGGVNEFDHRCKEDVPLALVAACSGAEQQDKRAQSFAAALDNISAQCADQGNIRIQSILDEKVDVFHVLLSKGDCLIQQINRVAVLFC